MSVIDLVNKELSGLKYIVLGGVLPIMAYTGRLPPERGTFFRLQVYFSGFRVGISEV